VAAGIVGTILVEETLSELVPIVARSPAYNGTAYVNEQGQNVTYSAGANTTAWFEGVQRYWILIALLSIIAALVYGAYIESKKGGRP